MASSTQQWNYDVFLCFRGEDTRKNFVGHLYTALHQRGIHTYFDQEALPLGVAIDVALFKAIKESRVAVVVFSENFTNSSYCLEQLAYIINCRAEREQIVIPIFYHVDPSDVGKQTGAFSLDYMEHRKDKNTIELWRKALVNAANLDGWGVGEISESICIKRVVETISNKLFPKEHLSEIETCLQDLKLRDGDHDVFLSFREEDTRFNFVDHLYSALVRHGILTYMAKEKYVMDPVDSHLNSQMKAIEASRISIVVLSECYASSLECMEELTYIMKCKVERGQIVIPIYYYVAPSDVRTQGGSYAEEFSNLESRNHPRVELWRKTLVDVSNLYGIEIRYIADGHEAKGIQLIVKKILNILFPDKDLIGLHTRLGDMKYEAGGMITIPSSSHIDLEHFRIPLHEIIVTTNNFSESNIIAKGGFGKVYRGLSKQHGDVAVKQLDRSGKQGDNEFMMEIALLLTYKHENIVSLVGFCDQDGEKILVLKYEINGSLDRHLHSKDLTWIQRLGICLDAAKGLKYLHEDTGAHHKILHRDIKSSNILLDENWKAKISDFGLSKIALANAPCSVIISRVCGTMGYVDPQYQDQNILSQKSDVYSFGVVLFEVLFSRLVNAQGHQFLPQLAQNHYQNETLDKIIDPGLRSQMNLDCLRTYSSIAYRCLKRHRDERPTMGLVVDQLQQAFDYQQGLSGYSHDVYISFRHRDTECCIVDDICAALHQGDVSTYKDDLTLSRDESVLLKAIERSRLFVIIFTKKFAVNSWYLDEVAKIIECMIEKRQFLLPMFLNVSRADVRTQKGYFGEVMSEYERHPRLEVWRNALVEATNAPGLEYSSFRSSADLVSKAVDEIKKVLSIASEDDGLH